MHVERDDCYAKCWLDPVRVEKSSGFKPSELVRIEELVGQNAVQIREAWDEFFSD